MKYNLGHYKVFFVFHTLVMLRIFSPPIYIKCCCAIVYFQTIIYSLEVWHLAE